MSGVLLDFLHAQVARAPDEEALVAGDARRTWRQLAGEVNALSWGLKARGVDPGDRVVVFLENGIEAVVALWAAHQAGAIVCLVNAHTKGDKLAYYLNDLGAKVLVTQANFYPAFSAAAPQAKALTCTVVAGAAQAGTTPWADVVAGQRTDLAPSPSRTPEDLAHVIYTSGTTGEPKGVALTQANMTFAAESTCAYLGLKPDDVLLGVLPLSFSYGLYQVLTAARVGAKVVLEKNFAFPVRVLERMAAERATCFAGVPTLFAMFAELKAPPPVDLSRVRLVTNAAAALPARLVPFIASRFPNARFFSMYGQTECMRISYLPPELSVAKPSSVGVPIPGTSFEVVDDAGQKVAPGVTGELVVTGAHVMQGYWNRPDETAKKVTGGPAPETRRLWTGDACRLDADGHLFVVGRKDDVIKSRGEKVAPLEVERALLDVAGVREAAVVGVPDEVLGQAVKAFVVLEAGAQFTERQLLLECQKRLEPHLVPKHVEFRAELPKNPSGKVLKGDLR